MRIALATAQVPFVRGGAELLAESLQSELRARGHEAEQVAIPFNWYPARRLRDSMQAAALLDLSGFGAGTIDLMVGMKFPAYLARHPRKAFWLVHQHRQAYERWDAGDGDLCHQPEGRAMRAAILEADRQALASRPVYTISRNVSARLSDYLGIASTPLYHPPPLAALLRPGEAADYVLAPSRLAPDKRQALLLRALARCRQPVRMVFVGAPDAPAHADELRALAGELGLAGRVEWRRGVPGPELAGLYAGALAVAFVPRDEDYGYVTLEAMLAGKPLVTAADAGGPLEFVEDGEHGLVAAPDADALAAALDRLWADRALAARLGAAGLARYRAMDIGWDRVIEALLRPVPPAEPSAITLPALPAPAPPADPAAERAAEDAHRVAAVLQRAGVADLRALLDGFGFGAVRDEVEAYLQGHWRRFLETAALLPEAHAPRVLDLGSARPHVFLGLVRRIYGAARFDAVAESAEETAAQDRYDALPGEAPLVVDNTAFNLETARFPYPDASFDLVLAMEVVEHLMLDPLHLFNEIARVLRPGGSVIVTTPNIASDLALAKLMRGDAPYSFGVFVPYHGPYGRHNREYTPHEIEGLGLAAGLRTAALVTRDIYPERPEGARAAAAAMPGLRNPPLLRGQNIFYRGVKDAAPPAPPPASLYLEDPAGFRGRMTMRPPEGPERDMLPLALRNEGTRDWHADTVALHFLLYDETGRPAGALRLPLPCLVPANEERTLALPVAPRPGQPCRVLRVALERNGRGDLRHSGVPHARLLADADALGRIALAFGISRP